MKCEEIFAALAMLEKERGIPQNFMMGKIIQALTTAYKRDHEARRRYRRQCRRSGWEQGS